MLEGLGTGWGEGKRGTRPCRGGSSEHRLNTGADPLAERPIPWCGWNRENEPERDKGEARAQAGGPRPQSLRLL